MGYIEIIKNGFKVGNRNLGVLLTQFIAGLALVLVLAIFVGAVIFGFAGVIANISLKDISADYLTSLAQTSIALIPIFLFFLLLFLIIAAILTAYVHSGNLGCIIDTAKGDAPGFTTHNFFATANRSALSMLGLYILWGFIFVGVTLFFVILGALVIGGVLMPLKDAGRQLLAFALGVPFLVVFILVGLVGLFFFYAGWTFSAIILVAERRTAFASFKGSYGFIKKNFWDALLFALLLLFIVFAGNMAANLITMPFSVMAETKPIAALGFLPLVLISVLLQMYVGLIARSSLAVYYVDRSIPPAVQPPAAEEEILSADIAAHEEEGGAGGPGPQPPDPVS